MPKKGLGEVADHIRDGGRMIAGSRRIVMTGFVSWSRASPSQASGFFPNLSTKLSTAVAWAVVWWEIA